MPHQCVRCSRVIPAGSKELLEGCKECKGHFFFYIKDPNENNKTKEKIVEMPDAQKDIMEADIREMVDIMNPKAPIILDIESIRMDGEGKFELDIAKIFRKDQPVIYKLEEGKYIIDLASTLKINIKDLKQIRNPDE